MALIDRDITKEAFNNEDTDLMADYGPEYGTECGFSRDAIDRILDNIPVVAEERESIKPGTPVWVLERDESGQLCDIAGQMFLAEVQGFVILTSWIDDIEGVVETLEYHTAETVDNYGTDLAVYPAEDCYTSQDAARIAVSEQGGLDDR